MNRLDFEGLDWGSPQLNDAWRRGREHAAAQTARWGADMAGELHAAQKFLALSGRARDRGALKQPPAGWSFEQGAAAAIVTGSELRLSDAERIDFALFWQWYLPVENALSELCRLVRFFHEHREEHGETFDALCVVGHDLRQLYDEWLKDQRIGWLPQRLGWGARGNRQQLTIIQLLGKHLIEFDNATPPAWATERIEAPMELPF
jgi:hypothetical protein